MKVISGLTLCWTRFDFDPVSRVDNQRRLFVELMRELRPRWHSDPGQPRFLTQWLTEKRAGSRDRKLFRELAYTAWRTLPTLDALTEAALVAQVAAWAEETPATAAFIDAFRPAAPLPLPADLELLPSWTAQECPTAIQPPHLSALLRRAPLWIRLQTDQANRVAEEFDQLGIGFTPHDIIKSAWQIAANAPLQTTQAFRDGQFEIQDIGSQSLLHSLPDRPTGHWLDACAGAGGKTLQLAHLLGTAGKVTAHDIRVAALQELERRVARAGLLNVAITTEPTETFDAVLVDAPCTGSGTWRRSPHLKWTTSLETIAQAVATQATLLTQFAPLVAPGGLLVYATCSLCRRENEAVATDFLAHHSHFKPSPLLDPATGATLPGGQLSRLPADLDSDAFFIAAFRREGP